MIASAAILALVVLLILAYGLLDQSVLRSFRPVAVVNGDRISTKDFEAQTRYYRYTLIRNAVQTYQFAAMFGLILLPPANLFPSWHRSRA